VAVIEKILPSGVFIRARPITGSDLAEARKMSQLDSGLDMTYCLMVQAFRIDDKPITYKWILEADIRDVMVMETLLAGYISGAVR
jgi:hypothetical protein